jgi:aminoglycoside phosphotransferase (APT) family kinase protein
LEIGTTADSGPTIDIALVRRLVRAQFPQWAGLPLRLLGAAGSDHVIFRLGSELSVRLPRHTGAIRQARKEAQWLPRLAPVLKVDGAFDATAMTELWDAAMNVPGWEHPPVWFHGDFHTGNLLTTGGRLSAVIDFGELGIGDPPAT